MASFMDFFKPAQPQQQQQTQQPATPQTPAGQTPPAQTPPAGQQTNGTNTQPNPLDAYKQMFDNAAKNSPETPPAFTIPEETLTKVSSSIDFIQSVPQEIMQKALTGDAQALIQAMNHVAQNAYKTSLSHTTSLTDQYVGVRSKFDQSSLGSRVKSELTSQEISALPGASHPLIKQELARVAQQMAVANPEAAPAEIAKAAQQYIHDLYSAVNPAKPAEQTAGEVDWGNYFK